MIRIARGLKSDSDGDGSTIPFVLTELLNMDSDERGALSTLRLRETIADTGSQMSLGRSRREIPLPARRQVRALWDRVLSARRLTGSFLATCERSTSSKGG